MPKGWRKSLIQIERVIKIYSTPTKSSQFLTITGGNFVLLLICIKKTLQTLYIHINVYEIKINQEQYL